MLKLFGFRNKKRRAVNDTPFLFQTDTTGLRHSFVRVTPPPIVVYIVYFSHNFSSQIYDNIIFKSKLFLKYFFQFIPITIL